MAINRKDVIYFVLTDRFHGVENPRPELREKIDKSNPQFYHGGNFDGIVEQIPYLKKLGITALWITPVYRQIDLEHSHGYHGYWALDFNAVNPFLYIDNGRYPEGSKCYLKDLVDRLHASGIKVILDIVVNHTGYRHPGINGSSGNPTPIGPSWFNRMNISLESSVTEGQLSGLPDMDLDSPDVCDYHAQSILSWIRETGIDGIRMDTVRHVERNFWTYFKTQVKGQFPEVTLLGEVLVFDIDALSQYQKFDAIDQLFDFPLQQAMTNVFVYDHAMTDFVSPYNLGTGILERDLSYTNHNQLVTLLDNHDLSARFMTSILDAQMGDYRKATDVMKLSLTFLFAIRGIPQIYYGTELGLEGRSDPDNRRDFPWGKLDKDYEVKEAYPFEKEIYDHTRNMIRIRRTNDALSAGHFVCLYVDYFLLVFLRYIGENIIIAGFHNGWLDMPSDIAVDIGNNPNLPRRIKEKLADAHLVSLLGGPSYSIREGRLSLLLGGKSGVILTPAEE
ncbi:MAG: Beta/alpha-amylase precursor [Syntrophus sp. PtaU1.Bin005]|uniref:alpha-amylase family glycosyl hydrolase n=1 Tax=Syntrophus buswellii TaxID=43774 RepID=UPI0009CFF3C1|nr:MAG: Beta/alpha-amylase precursor [Syntrophus sp. PtaB.Bin138]OPY83782.1 MAG: Beta/alpha-amylase precursor [Syntrophus sp. PtaU1.Bin005]